MGSSGVRLLGAIFLSLVLAACGGGGGGGSTGGGGTASGTGLIPTASPLGATLVADATTLRPLIAGASWGYAGTDTVNGSSTTYTDTVTQTASAGTFTESASNGFNGGADTSTVSASGGTVTSRTVAELIEGASQQLSYAELRSPVRQNDQVTVLDQHYADIGADLDGDGKHESGDIGVYRVVVGMEDVALPNGSTQHAVRVDMIGMVRVTLSSNGAVSPATRAALQSTWYAPGIGIVKQRLTTPVSSTSDEVVEEVLTYFDGVTTGFGAKPAAEVRVSADAAVGAGQPLPDVNAVVAFPDHAVLVGTFMDVAQLKWYTALSSIDTNGKVLRTNLYTGVPTNGFLALGGQLVAVVDGRPTGQYCQASLLHFDAHGGQFNAGSNSVITFPPAPGKTLCSNVIQLMSASDGNRLWLAAVRQSLSTSGWVTDLFVQPFDAQGTPLAGETTLLSANAVLTDSLSSGGVALRSVSAAGGKVVVGYATDTSGSLHLASVTDAGVLTQASVNPTTLSSNGPTLLATSSAAALLWQGPQDAVTQLAPARGVLLDSNLVPLLSNGGSLDAQTLSASLASCGSCTMFRNGAGDKLLVTTTQWASDQPLKMTFANLSASAGALPSQAVSPVQVSLADVSNYAGGISQYEVVPFADRVLVLATANSRLYAKVAWLP